MHTAIRMSALVAAAALTLSACAATAGQAGPAQTGVNAPSSSSSSSSSTTEDVIIDTPEETPTEDDSTLQFGQTQTYEDGLSVKVSAPKSYRPSDTAMADPKFKTFLSFTVTIVNKTGKAFDPSMFHATVQSGDVEGDQVFDSAKGMNGSPDTKLLNGRQARFNIAFGVANPKDIVMEAAPGFEYDSALFTR